MRYLICEAQFPTLFAAMRRAYLSETGKKEHPAIFLIDIEPDYSMMEMEHYLHSVQFVEPLVLVAYLNGEVPIHALRNSVGDTLPLRAFQGIVEGLISDIRRSPESVIRYPHIIEGEENAVV